MNENELKIQLDRFSSCVDKFQSLIVKMDKVLSKQNRDGLDGWISEENVKELTGLSTSTLYELRKTKKVLSSFITPKSIVYNKKSLIKLIEKNARK